MVMVYARAAMRSRVLGLRRCAAPVTTDADEARMAPPERTDLGCKMAAAGPSGILAESSQGSATSDLRHVARRDLERPRKHGPAFPLDARLRSRVATDNTGQ
jgi:hypothetical protein